MAMPEKRNPGSRADGAGASNSTHHGHGLSLHHARIIDRLQFRLSANALALDALGPDLDFAMRCAHLMSLGMPLPGDAPQRLNRLSLRLIDARHVLEAELPPEAELLNESSRRREVSSESDRRRSHSKGGRQ